MEALSKKFLRRKFAGRPFLCLLVQDVWFRLGFIGFVILLVSLGLFLPRIWTASPPGFRPVVKVSGLDLAQAWSLKRSALKSMASGQFDEAYYAWMAALANNRADADLVRGVLQCVSRSENQQKYRKAVLPHALWLLQLSGTNGNDLEFVVKVLHQYGYFDLVVSLLNPNQPHLTPALEAAYLKALFHTGRIAAFGNRWPPVQANLPSDPELPLYHAAWLAGGSSLETSSGALQALDDASQKPEQRTLACRLMLAASLRRMDTRRCGEILERLQHDATDTLPDHIAYWRLLAQSGRKTEALRLVDPLPRQPASTEEAIALAQLYREWGLRNQALGVYKRFAADFRESAEIWIAYARTLLEARDWDELRRVALQIRIQAPAGPEELAAYTYYLEGRAEIGLHRHFHAASAFQRMVEWGFHDPKLGLETADALVQLGYPELARKVLLKLEKSLDANAEYWSVLFQAAERLKQADLMLSAARQAYRLQPRNPAFANNYAASLLIHRQSPEETVQLTLRAVSRSPHSATALINHAAGLLLNERAEEALAILNGIDTSMLTPAQRTLYQLDRFEACLKLLRIQEARSISESIELDHLYPPQVRWFEQARSRFSNDPRELAVR